MTVNMIPAISKKPTRCNKVDLLVYGVAVPATPYTRTTQQPSWIAAQQHNKTGCTTPNAVIQVYAPDDGRNRPKHVELKEHQYSNFVASSWFFTNYWNHI
jgi:hypothetical protein